MPALFTKMSRPPKRFHGFRHHALRVRGLAHIGLDQGRAASQFLDGIAGFLGALSILIAWIIDGDVGAFFRQPYRDALPDALTCAGDQSSLAA